MPGPGAWLRDTDATLRFKRRPGRNGLFRVISSAADPGNDFGKAA